MDGHPDSTRYLELLRKLDACVKEELEGNGSPVLTEAEGVAVIVYTLGALMAAGTFERHEASRSGALEEKEALFGEFYQGLLLAIKGCEGIDSRP